MMSEVCNNISIEPHLQPLSGEALHFMTPNSDSNAQLDIAANGFWGGRFEHSFFDVRVFNPIVYHQITLLSLPIAIMHEKVSV